MVKRIKIEKTAPTTMPGYVNANKQEVIARSGTSETRAGQHVYQLRCGRCGFEYGSNGIDNEKRLCPRCQGGAIGEKLRERGPGLFG